MEIKILVKENKKAELDKFIKTCKEYGMKLTREGGGKLPNFSGYYAELKGVRWQKADSGKGQSNIPVVRKRFCAKPMGYICLGDETDARCGNCGHWC